MSHQVQPPDHETTVDYQEGLTGRVFRWSLVVAGILASLGTLAWWLTHSRKPKPVQVTTLTAPVVPEKPVAHIPQVPFTDITRAAGIHFTHINGAYGDKLLPETMGGGVAFLDFDGDGDQDLLFVNSAEWPWKQAAGKKPATPHLYRNDGTGKFEDVTAGSGLDVSVYGMGVATGDADGDGRTDVLFTTVGGCRLFRNLGSGRFADVTTEAGVGGKPEDWASSAAFADYDRDGDLDLFVAHYVQWSREIDFEVGYKLVGVGRAYGQPNNFPGTFPIVYRNDGGGKFTDVSAAAGVQVKNSSTGRPAAKSLGVSPVDLDGDGWIDFVVANDTVQNFVFHNQRDGTFREVGASTGIAFDSYGNARGAMGIDVARFRNDDTLGIGIGNFANEMTALYVAAKPGSMLFTDDAIPEGIGPASRLPLKFGLFFFDYDLDGWLDLLTANGHLEEEISKVQQSQRYAQPAQLFWNAGGSPLGGGFLVVPEERGGGDLFRPIVGRGSAFADIDGDGDQDVVLTQIGGAPLLLRNDQALGHAWARLVLHGGSANREAIGAWIRVEAGGKVMQRQVMPARSYLSQSELPVTIGLGKLPRPDRVEVLWPDGTRQTVTDIRINGITHVHQAASAVAAR